ncbi:hypothetical protein T03_10684 [Trichinella britovi]|uniref:Uncharacterized protein n=1 Tax=Trichinella britovi TaxID=45882 RepID=A0A0V0YXZ6_TRIBR|nr:hypothetical protein T03_10684 [Trichinella britovi]
MARQGRSNQWNYEEKRNVWNRDRKTRLRENRSALCCVLYCVGVFVVIYCLCCGLSLHRWTRF